MTDSAQGIDVSQFQAVLTAEALAGLDFCFAKATNGVAGEDPKFAANWAVLAGWKGHRGAYHELTAGSPRSQAQFMASVVNAAGGFKPGDMIGVVASDYPGVTDGNVKAFADEMSRLAGPHVAVLVYSDLSVATSLTESAAAYPLWAAWPADHPPQTVTPWDAWKLWQWQFGSEGTPDRDAYNGTPAEMAAWIASYAPPKPSPQWTEIDMTKLPVLKQGAADKPGSTFFVARLQALVACVGKINGLPAAEAVADDGQFGPATTAGVKAVQAHFSLAQDGVAGSATWGVLVAGYPS